jgi:hypothetical protein
MSTNVSEVHATFLIRAIARRGSTSQKILNFDCNSNYAGMNAEVSVLKDKIP